MSGVAFILAMQLAFCLAGILFDSDGMFGQSPIPLEGEQVDGDPRKS